jgi:hypothetical protein
VSPKRGDRVALPAVGNEWDVRFATSEAVKGWDDLCRQAPENTAKAWQDMRAHPAPHPQNPRHEQLKGSFAYGTHGGRQLAQWQIEVTSGGRIWYLLDTDKRTVWVQMASTRHPKATE